MKNALILHGTDGNSQLNWFPWLKEELEKIGYKVWVPDLPHAEKPNTKTYNDFLFANKDWQFNEESIIIGHSSGAMEILSLLQHLPEQTKVRACYLVGAFRNDLGWESLRDVFIEPFNFDVIKKKSQKFTFIHSDNDPYCPLEGAQFLAEKVGGELIIKEGQKHFSVGTMGEQYKKFPFLLTLIQT